MFCFAAVKVQINSTLKTNKYVICSGETENKSQGRCFSFSVQYCMTNIGPIPCAFNQTPRPNITLFINNKAHSYSRGAFICDSFYNSSSKVSRSYWKGVPQLLDRNALIVSDKNSMQCWFLLIMRNLSLRLFLCFTRAGHIRVLRYTTANAIRLTHNRYQFKITLLWPFRRGSKATILLQKQISTHTLRIGDTDRAIFFQFICFTKKWGIFFSHKYTNLM